jgi:hypothetical protein
MLQKLNWFSLRVLLEAVALLALPSLGFGQSPSCPNGCTVAIYSPVTTCSATPTSVSLSCAWGGPNTCCNPSIKSSDNGTISGATCTTQSQYQYTSKNSTGTYQVVVACCPAVDVDSACTTIQSRTLCGASIKIGYL